MVKEPCIKFCSVLISSEEVMKSQSFESGASDVIFANVKKIFKGMLRRKIEHFLKKRKYEKLGFSEMN